ncbi:MAG: pseudaminic acid cytidylyltransferase, partial [bacterium]|nr:pseudaminic acid cytidylyltransferase [bacterium]
KIEDGYLKMFWPENIDKCSQDLIPAYHDAGQFYWLNVDDLLKNKKIFADKSVGVELSEFEVQDIDTEDDWEIAEMKYNFISLK